MALFDLLPEERTHETNLVVDRLQGFLALHVQVQLFILEREPVGIALLDGLVDQREQVAVSVLEVRKTVVVDLLDTRNLEFEVVALHDGMRRNDQFEPIRSADCSLERIRKRNLGAENGHAVAVDFRIQCAVLCDRRQSDD